MLCIVYARVSTDEQARSGYSLGEQIRACRARAAELAGPAAAVLEFTDDMSGELLERPGLQAALHVVRSQKVDFFVCLDPDRLARRLMLQLVVTDEIERTGCRLEFVQHDYQHTPEGRLFYQMRGAFAEYEKLKILERTSRGARGKIAMGGIPHHLRLYGYEFVKGAGKVTADKALVPHPTEARMVYTMMRWCADEGLGPQAIANRLHELGVPTKTGRGTWNHTTVRRILRHEVYATGRLTLLKKDHRGIAVARQIPEEERRRRGITLTARPRPASEWQHVYIQPIVPLDLWQRCQEVLDGFRVGGRTELHPGRVRMLTGLGRCGVCGGPLYYYSGRKISCYARYQHYHTPRAEPNGCTLPAKPAKAVEEAVWQEVLRWLLDEEAFSQALRLAEADLAAPTMVDVAGLQHELSTLEAQLSAKREEQERTGLLFSRGLWPADMALPALERIGQEISTIEARLAELRDQLTNNSNTANSRTPELAVLLHDRAWREQVAITADQLDDAKRIELVRLAVGRFIMHPSGRGAPPRVTVYPRV